MREERYNVRLKVFEQRRREKQIILIDGEGSDSLSQMGEIDANEY